MVAALHTAIDFIKKHKADNRAANKAAIQDAFSRRFRPTQIRSVFVGDGYAVRFSQARTGAVSNTVLSLSALQMHDARPFVVAVVRSRYVEFLLANSTFLKKISHSSHELRTNNIKGSFNGTDIMTEYEGIQNSPENFDQLFALHSAFTWPENVERLVEATNAITFRDARFQPTSAQRTTLLEAPQRASEALSRPAYQEVEKELTTLVQTQREQILTAASIDNVNLRGNTIEQILTESVNVHGLGDVVRPLDGGRLIIDIKTKLLDRASAPQAYHVDKFLEFLAEPGSVFAFFMLAVRVERPIVQCRLLSVFDEAILNATGVQHHWAGRGSLGVTQLSGQFGRASEPDYAPRIDVVRARSFLERLLTL